MRTLVLYFSLTGRTRSVAEALADALDAEIAAVDCPAYRRWYGGLLLGLDMATRRRPRITAPPVALSAYDLVVLGGPVWGGRPAMPVMRFLAENGRGIGQLALFVTCGGSSPKWAPEPALAEMAAAAAGEVAATHIFRERDILSSDYRRGVADFAAAIRAAAPPPG